MQIMQRLHALWPLVPIFEAFIKIELPLEDPSGYRGPPAGIALAGHVVTHRSQSLAELSNSKAPVLLSGFHGQIRSDNGESGIGVRIPA